MRWQFAPDERMLRTLDWMNDGCEAHLMRRKPKSNKIIYRAIMSPVRVSLPPSRISYAKSSQWPVSLFVTDDALVVGIRRRLGRSVGVRRFELGQITTSAGRRQLSLTFRTEEEVAVARRLLAKVSGCPRPWKSVEIVVLHEPAQ
jgi:hypothetical protein